MANYPGKCIISSLRLDTQAYRTSTTLKLKRAYTKHNSFEVNVDTPKLHWFPLAREIFEDLTAREHELVNHKAAGEFSENTDIRLFNITFQNISTHKLP